MTATLFKPTWQFHLTVFFPFRCIKATLLPSPVEAALSCCTRSITDLSQAIFDETFRLAVASSKLEAKTLQISVHSRPVAVDSQEDCMGWAQVSLADFRPDTNTVKWYNVLALKCLPSGHPLSSVASETSTGLKEESSDESTIVSSQPSTLTRNQRTLPLLSSKKTKSLDYIRGLCITGGPMSGLEVVEQGTDSEDEDDSDEESETDDDDEEKPEEEDLKEHLVDQVLEKVEHLVVEEDDEEEERVYAVEPVKVGPCFFFFTGRNILLNWAVVFSR